MKLTVILVIVAILQVSAAGYAQRVSLSEKSTPMEEVLTKISNQTGFHFLYTVKLLNLSRPVTVDLENASLDEALAACFDGQRLTYAVNNKTIIISRAVYRKENLKVQISGRVTEASGQPIPGVSVRLKGTSLGVSTDGDGKFTFAVPGDNGILIFSSLGYKTKEITFSDQRSIDIVLDVEVAALNEVLVVGYGTQSRETLTTAISKLDSEVLENVPYANATSALQGALPGVRVQSTTGQPGATPRVIVRGGASINSPGSATPLYLIDGIIRTDMSDISADDIESMQVLKDAASTAIYGARASNGVVIVTTKSGKAGKTRISYSYDATLSETGRQYEFASAHDYIHYGRLGILAAAEKNPANLNRLTLPNGMGTGNDLTNNTAFTPQYLSAVNQHKLNEGWQSMPDPVDPTKTIIYQETDFQNLVYRTGVSNNHYITASGGSEKATFNAGLGYLLNQGVAIESDFSRLTFNLNSTFNATDRLNFTGRMAYSNSSAKGLYSTVEQSIFRASGLPSTAKYAFEDGTLSPGQSRSLGNPDYYKDLIDGENSNEKISMSLASHWKILPGLSFDPLVSLYKNATDAYSFLPAYYNGVGATALNKTRTASGSYNKFFQYQADAVFTYMKAFAGIHNLEVKAGYSYLGRTASGLSASGNGASTDLIPTLNASAVPTAVGGSISAFKTAGYFTRLTYDYDQRYLLSASMRYDGASNLGENNKWGYFPAVSIGWNLHREKFWKSLPEGLLRLKMRASYGENGNILGIDDFQPQGTYTVGDQYSGAAAITNSVIPNQNLSWESSKTFDVGADVGLFKDRVSLIFDWYRKQSYNLLTTLTLPQSTGFGSVFTNLGSLESKGIELDLGVKILPATSAVKWNVSFNAAKINTKILKLPDNGVEKNRVGGVFVWDPSRGDYAWLGGLQEGGRIGDFYSYEQLGVYATDQDAAAGPVDQIVAGTNKKKVGGDVNWLDADNNGIIDERDRTYRGNPTPVWTGGFSSVLSYKNIGMNVRLDYATGHTIYNYQRGFYDNNWQGDVLMTKEYIEKSWKKQGDVTDVPRYYWNDQTQFNTFRGNSVYFEKADYLALRELTLSYSVPQRLLQKIKLSNFRVNVTGNNLYYFTRYKGLNPEAAGAAATGDNRGGDYPLPRNLIFGATITL